MTTAQPGRSRREAFTILEMVVVLVLLGILIAFIYPRLSGNETLARDQRAQTSASAALDAVGVVFSSIGAGALVATPPEAPTSATTCTTQGTVTPIPARRIMDGAPYPIQDLSKTPSTYATACPLFANPAALQSTTGDVHFEVDSGGAPVASTGLGSVSVAAANTGLAWRVWVAVLSPRGGAGITKATISTCWMAWREYPLGRAGSASARERYFYVTNLSADVTNCTGAEALQHGSPPVGTAAFEALKAMAAPPNLDYLCEQDPRTGKPVWGLSWRAACGDQPR